MQSNYNFISNSIGVLKQAGRRKGIKNLFDSNKWEFGCKHYTRSWKAHRAKQHK